jgi:hypothetical protein
MGDYGGPQFKTNGYPARNIEPLTTEGGVLLTNITDSNGDIVEIGAATRAIITVDYARHEVHEGDFFEYVNAQNLTNSQTISFLVITPDTTKWAHFGFKVDGESEFDLQMFIDATPDNIGSIVSNPAVINANNNASAVHTTMLYEAPVLGAGSKGTLIKRWHGGSGKSAGGSAGTITEVILKQNTKYWFDVTNSTVSNNFVTWFA